ncbi:stage II sporulation protein P [Brevibacillus dissolubilis]|uniref:stage II sporulation protein P n=1 Tax=Brevibacillus dissolubilis TaxID=1844116 RepID=UPI0011171434|nr:stage II sporulation protein P [Brevibacillus dissolubilis]
MATLLQRHFVLLSVGTALLFLLCGALVTDSSKDMFKSSTLNRATSHVSSLTLINLLGMEIPAFHKTVQAQVEPQTTTTSSFFFQLATGIHPGDLRSLLGRELPGLLTYDDARILVKGKDFELADLYVESPAPAHTVIEMPETPAPAEKPTETPKPADDKPAVPIAPGDSKKKSVFVYHTHNRESWIGISKPAPATDSIDHPSQNITLVGKKLGEALSAKGIGTQVNTDDFYQKLLDNGRSYPFSYAESLKAVRAATQQNRDLKFYFDLHRDSNGTREKTTVKINAKNYARLLFVVGTRNKNHEQNEKFARELHALMEKKYPALSRGIIAKTASEGNGEYNQSISPGSLLVEVGGTHNTIQECYNTAEAFADVFAEYYWQAEEVSKTNSQKPDKR